MSDPQGSCRLALDRRTLVKGRAASGAALAASAAVRAGGARRQDRSSSAMSARRPGRSPPSPRPTISSSRISSNDEGRRLKIGNDSYPVEVVVKDSQSNPNRAADVARELIVDDKVDLMLVASTPETTNPVSTMCEVEEMPCISTVAPWQPYFIGRQAEPGGSPASWKPFNYTFHFFWGLEDVIAVFTNMWGQLATNKSVGGLFPNDGDGNAWGDKQVGFPPVLDKLGYKLTDPGRYQNLTDDFSAQITAFKTRRLRDRHRRGAAAGLHHVLEPGEPAGLQAEDRHRSARRSCSRSRSRRWARTATTSPPRCGGRRAIRSSRR